ncbi:hypothetical protein PRZ48_008264 [Zasmidium cellare]|uniref:Uncharacterized protein n=1 Tax=Zasmidium cellare TaxID=395010 RepID=A0ABR0EG85_ZASCE|nr:hypothetical protein PRZ48_008264 [Zasmidium cellare]
MGEDDVYDSTSSSSNLASPKKHWLQRTPLNFLNLCACREWKEAIAKDATLIYDRLTLHLCFFTNGSLQLFKEKSGISSNENGFLGVPFEVVEIDADDPMEHKMRRPEQDIPIHDLVLSMLQDEIRSGALRGVQFLDFMFDDYVLVKRSSEGKVKDGWEHRGLEVAVMLSLDPATVMSLGRTLAFPRLGRSPVYHQPDLLLLSPRTAQLPRTLSELDPLLDHSLLERLFERKSDFHSGAVINHHHRYDKEDWERKLCGRRITSVVSVWKAFMSHPRDQTIYGFVAYEKDYKKDIFVFLMDKYSFEKNERKEFSYDFGDGGGKLTYKVIGRLAVGDFSTGDCASFSRWSDGFVQSIIGQDARVRITIVDLWNV